MSCRVLISCLTAVFLSTACLNASEDPSIRLKASIKSALNIFYEPGAEEISAEDKCRRIAALLSESYDLSILMRRAMGRNWKKLSASEQEEVLVLFEELIVKVTYDRLSNGTEKPLIKYKKTVYESDKRVRIASSLLYDGMHYSVEYRLGKLATGWQIYDIVTENISMVSNYRQQFDDHFRRSDGASLINKLKQMVSNQDESIELTL